MSDSVSAPPPPPMPPSPSSPAGALDVHTANPGMKLCIYCKVLLPIADFRKKSPSGGAGLISYCMKCQIEYCREYRKKFPKGKKARQTVAEPPVAYAPAEDPPEGSYTLYIMRNPLLPGMIKIGKATCPSSRAQDLSRQQPFELLVCYTYSGWGSLETSMHHKLQHVRVTSGRGREWFWLEPEHANTLVLAAILESEIAAKAQAWQS